LIDEGSPPQLGSTGAASATTWLHRILLHRADAAVGRRSNKYLEQIVRAVLYSSCASTVYPSGISTIGACGFKNLGVTWP
jgi:hypothetical protein